MVMRKIGSWIIHQVLLGFCFVCSCYFLSLSVGAQSSPILPKEIASAKPFDVSVQWYAVERGVRVLVDAPSARTAAESHPPRTLVIYATPNGNSIEHTYGCRVRAADGALPASDKANARALHWQYDIQHVAAQMRRLREVDREREWIFAIVQAKQLSWPAFRSEHPDANAFIVDLVHALAKEWRADRIVLTGHSGGGSMMWGFIEASEEIPDTVERMVFLDANYSFSHEAGHGKKLARWLHRSDLHRLIVLAYDDREITLDGKKVIGPDGGTFRATQRMVKSFREEGELAERSSDVEHVYEGFASRLRFVVRENPQNKILHTAIVGEMNGLLYGLTVGSKHESQWGIWGGPRAYSESIGSEPISESGECIPRRSESKREPPRLAIPPRTKDAIAGQAFASAISQLNLSDRESAIQKELLAGNVPSFLRQLQGVDSVIYTRHLKRVSGTYFVTPDYMSVGEVEDFFRVPVTLSTAIDLCQAFQASLVTRKISDDLHRISVLRMKPEPMTEDREMVKTFWEHHQRIEKQLGVASRSDLVTGIKKDLIWSQRLKEKPGNVAIYGWHSEEGRPFNRFMLGMEGSTWTTVMAFAW